MNNSTCTTKSPKQEETKLMNIIIVLNMLVQFVALVLHALIQYIIHKGRLSDDKQYYVVRLLSIADLLTLVVGILMSLFTLADYNQRWLMVSFTLLLYIFVSESMQITIVIAVDRWVAVKYALRYHALVILWFC